MIDPRKGNYKKFGINELINYKKNVNNNVTIIYPVNECTYVFLFQSLSKTGERNTQDSVS